MRATTVLLMVLASLASLFRRRMPIFPKKVKTKGKITAIGFRQDRNSRMQQTTCEHSRLRGSEVGITVQGEALTLGRSQSRECSSGWRSLKRIALRERLPKSTVSLPMTAMKVGILQEIQR